MRHTASLVLAATALAIAGCSHASPERGSLGGIGLYQPKERGSTVVVDFAVMTSFPNADDDHAERDRRFHWVSLRLAGREAVATHQSKMVDKTREYVDTSTFGKSAWRDRWRAALPADVLAAYDGRMPMTVRACDETPRDGVHCEQRAIDVCVRDGRLRGEVTAQGRGASPRGTGGGIRSYTKDFSCRRPVFNAPHLDSASDPDPNPDFE